ncbi:hypothetical protein B7494_g3145 [Chlorociboria aeruginascens]|nr:hypothetical protein B7494_g3145 [Chlorociboria aeruginascens]
MGKQQGKSTGEKSTGCLPSTTSNENLGLQKHQSKSNISDFETKSTRSKQSISTTDPGFQGIAFDNGILDPDSSKPNTNLKFRQERIDRSRDTASPSESDYGNLLIKYGQLNVGFNNGLSAAQPDMVEGLELPEFNPFPVRQQLGRAIVPTLGPHTITLPHLAGEWKGPGKNMATYTPSAIFQEINQDEFVQIFAAGSVHVSPYAIFPANDEEDPLQGSTANNRNISPNGQRFPLVTPPQSSEETWLPLEASEDTDRINLSYRAFYNPDYDWLLYKSRLLRAP